MSPTIFKVKGYRFFFFSREENRIHVHVHHGDGEAKFWMEPEITLVRSVGLNDSQISEILKIIKEHKDEIKSAWLKHFGG